MKTNLRRAALLGVSALAAAGTSMHVMNGPDPALKADPAKLVDDIQKAFADFQAANDNRLKEIAKGQEDVVRRAEVDKINAAISELKTSLEQRAKEQARMEISGGAKGGNAIDIRAAAARFQTIRSGGKRRIRPEDADVGAYQAYQAAFEELTRSQFNIDNVAPDIRAAMSVGSDPAGGYLVPTEMSMEIERRIFETSPVRQLARVISISSDAWEAPYKSDDATSGGWVGEKQSRTATNTPQVGMQRITVHEQYAYPEVTQQMLDDAAIPVESFIVDETEDKMIRTENTAFVSGDGVGKPRGFMDYRTTAVTTDDASRNWGQLQYVVTGASADFPDFSGASGAKNPDALITLMSKLKPAYRGNANFVMSRATEATIRKLKDRDGRYFIGFGDLRDSPFNFSLLGTPIVNMEDMPAIGADSFSIAYGDFSGYLIVDRVGFRVLRDPFTNKPYVGFYITKRTGGDVRNFDKIKLLKFGTS